LAAAAGTGLIAIGYFVSPPGVAPQVAMINRALCAMLL
jgi:hypothetical protein